ncbi:hypothetical protein N0V88_008019 [Collariella sp. IMI 366227]|nr:hypothetical protein N0V88_008019 [Collariella sp. IMI 366227]
MNIRLATHTDLEAMTTVLIGASPMDPVYPYRFPDRHLYPDEFAALCRQKCAEYLESSTVVVCEMPVNQYSGATQVVAFSAWDMPSTQQTSRRASAPLPTTSKEDTSSSKSSSPTPRTNASAPAQP